MDNQIQRILILWINRCELRRFHRVYILSIPFCSFSVLFIFLRFKIPVVLLRFLIYHKNIAM